VLRNPKSQNPNPKQIPTLKSQNEAGEREKAAEDSRTPKRFAKFPGLSDSARSWSAAVLCRFRVSRRSFMLRPFWSRRSKCLGAPCQANPTRLGGSKTLLSERGLSSPLQCSAAHKRSYQFHSA